MLATNIKIFRSCLGLMGLGMCSFVLGGERILNLLFWFLMFLFEQENELLFISFSYGSTYG